MEEKPIEAEVTDIEKFEERHPAIVGYRVCGVNGEAIQLCAVGVWPGG